MENVVKSVGGEYLGNYTGPYWSNGKVQESVEWGDTAPQDELDYLSRQHDSAYKRFQDPAHRTAADEIYNEQAQKLAKKFPSLAGNLVLYGNMAQRSATRLAENVSAGSRMFGLGGALGGLIYTAAGNIVKANQMINGTYLRDERKDVQAYYSTDPLLERFKEFAPTKKISGSLKVAPMPKIDELSDPVEAQARKIQNYAALKKKADKSQTHAAQQEIPDWNMLGYQGRYKRYNRKNKNRVHLLPIR